MNPIDHPTPPDLSDQGIRLFLKDENTTEDLGAYLAPLLPPGSVVWLEGELGAGKTTLTRALLRAKGHTGPVKSPTYTLVEVYVISSLYLYHFDFYRFTNPEEFDEAGLKEYFRPDAICLVEWPDQAKGFVPLPDLRLCFRFINNLPSAGRYVECHANSVLGEACLKQLQHYTGASDASSSKG